MLLSINANTKIRKSDAKGEYLTAILHLAPAAISGHQVCPWSTEGCRQACLNTAGRGKFSSVQEARIRKTRYFFEDRVSFMSQLVKEISALCRKCNKIGVKPAVRLNGTSDILWEKIPVEGAKNVFALFPEVQFYDYTKAPPEKRTPPDNYRLVFSRKSADPEHKRDLLLAVHKGHNIAVVFRGELPAYFWGFPVIDGDKDDLRFLDPKGCVVGLSCKGAARFDTSGFVV